MVSSVMLPLYGFLREKFLVTLPTCAKLVDMLLTKRTYTRLGVSPLRRCEFSRPRAAFLRDVFLKQSTEDNQTEKRDEASASAQDRTALRWAVA